VLIVETDLKSLAKGKSENDAGNKELL